MGEANNKVRLFPLDVVLSVTTGRLVASKHIQAVYEILNYITRDNLYTHQLPRAGAECKPWLLRWHPKLAEVRLWLLDQLMEEIAKDDSRVVDDIVAGKDKMEACQIWVAIERERLGLPAELSIQRIPQDDHERKDPYDELIVMRGTDEGVILVSQDNVSGGPPR
jgi:hypothetical protein